MTPREVLAKHGSSFYLASRFLRPNDARDIAILYAACRLIDDLADEQQGQTQTLETLQHGLEANNPSCLPVDGFAEMATRRNLSLAPLATLATSASQESRYGKVIETQAELLEYSYAVAGTVGELMCPLLGADPQRGADAAIALGIAMQLTNISRDVLEDAQQGRRYLPADWVNNLSPAEIASASPTQRAIVSAAIQRLIALAEDYYAAAAPGFALIPWRNRQAIKVATQLYRAIGLQVAKNGCRYWDGRVSLNTRQRAGVTWRTLIGTGDAIV